MRTRRENFPDLERPLQLNALNHPHRVALTLLSRIFRQDRGYFRTSTIVQSRNITAAPTNDGLINGGELLAGRCDLGGAVGTQGPCREALSDKGVNIDAEVGPTLAGDQGVRHLDLVLRHTHLAYTVQKANLAPTLCTFIYRLHPKDDVSHHLHYAYHERSARRRMAHSQVYKAERPKIGAQCSDLRVQPPSFYEPCCFHHQCYESLYYWPFGRLGWVAVGFFGRRG